MCFRALSAEKKRDTFFSWWTRKEAFMKAVGAGFSANLDFFDAVLVEKTPGAFPCAMDDGRPVPWSIWDVHPVEGIAGAVVAAGSGWKLRMWQWPG
jgi:4'-phosphopantetheinyl transferase